ncbi:MAG TPA: acetyl-CoA carboxylase biotin carboxyl carrier protein [Thermoanaerobaculia bacterium]|nr:acetyl-CoA carboxylase biotin carboxyl carrier protein [Thermoanaerobaculia bacterium]
MNFKEILELIDKVAALGIGEIEIEQAGTRVRIQGKASPPQVIHSYVAEPQREMPSLHSSHAPATLLPAKAQEEEADAGLHIVTSPIVGTFYRSPNPESEPFVTVGDHVSKGKVLCIIEAMKLMNEIESDIDGEIVKVFPQNGQPVEYGEQLFAVRL